MQELLECLNNNYTSITIPNMIYARKKIFEQTGKDIPVYILKMKSGLCVYIPSIPDLDNTSKFIKLESALFYQTKSNKIIVDKESIEYIYELK